MKILDNLSINSFDKKKIKKKSLLKDGEPQIFSIELSKNENSISSFEHEINNLRRDIEITGEKLEKEPNLVNFGAFRDLLSKLAKQISSEAYRLEKIGGTVQNPRYYEVITIINNEADRLYNLIVHEQRNRMAITAKVIGIKGLVVDLIT